MSPCVGGAPPPPPPAPGVPSVMERSPELVLEGLTSGVMLLTTGQPTGVEEDEEPAGALNPRIRR